MRGILQTGAGRIAPRPCCDGRLNRGGRADNPSGFLVGALLAAAVAPAPWAGSGTPEDRIPWDNGTYPLYPRMLAQEPPIPPPWFTADGRETVTCFTRDGRWFVAPVTVENGEPLDYESGQWYGKGLRAGQCGGRPIQRPKGFSELQGRQGQAAPCTHRSIQRGGKRTVTPRPRAVIANKATQETPVSPHRIFLQEPTGAGDP